ncbi:MAG: DUF3418 domain-containing protein [Candidatus Marinimicrobia bacterium]|nr:DUF3418 domain-containing protein [Candidatus Neomarinimicrobiota bacterium]
MDNSTNNFESVIEKIEEMRDFLKIGDEIVPFLTELFSFMQDVMPIMKEANHSLKDGSQRLPTASNRIRDVDQTTEMATHEILDKLGNISDKLDALAEDLDASKVETIEDIKEEANSIIFSLQFQDITAQKLEHADRILNAIRKKFTKLSDRISKVKIKTEIGKKVMQDLTSEEPDEELKRDLEEMDKETEDVIREGQIDQDDIDKLFE